MAKQRFINTKLWSDSWIRKLNPLDRFLFLYFLTNEHTNICGIYEVALETVAFETGIELDTLSKSMLPRLEPKIFYIKDGEDGGGWVCISNFEKHQRARGNEKIAKGIENAKNEVPQRIIALFEEKKRYSIDRLSKSTNYSDSDRDIDRDIDHTARGAEDVNPFIELFSVINPSYKTLFPRKPQRAAASRLLKQHPLEWWSKFIQAYAAKLTDRYCPKALTPIQMEEKLGAIFHYAEGLKNTSTKGNNFII